MKEIIIEVSPEGEVTITPKGFKGKACLEATKPYEQALGVDDSKRQLKPEFYQKEENQQQLRH